MSISLSRRKHVLFYQRIGRATDLNFRKCRRTHDCDRISTNWWERPEVLLMERNNLEVAVKASVELGLQWKQNLVVWLNERGQTEYRHLKNYAKALIWLYHPISGPSTMAIRRTENAKMGLVRRSNRRKCRLPAVLTAAIKKWAHEEQLVSSLLLVLVPDWCRKQCFYLRCWRWLSGEVGSASAMSAAALDLGCRVNISAMAGTLSSYHWAHHDPILVWSEVPCVKRNAMGLALPLSWLICAWLGYQSKIPVDSHRCHVPSRISLPALPFVKQLRVDLPLHLLKSSPTKEIFGE